MAIEKCRRKIGNLGIELDAPFGKTLHHSGSQHIRQRVDGRTGGERLANAFRLGFRRSAVGANPGEFGRDFRKLLCRDGAVALPGQKPARSTVIRNLPFRVADTVAQVVNFRGKPTGRIVVRFKLRGLLKQDVLIGQRVGDILCRFRVRRRILHHDDARSSNGKNLHVLAQFLQDALFRGQALRIGPHAKHDENAGPGLHFRCREGFIAGQLELVGNFLEKIAGGEHLDLALHPFGIEKRTLGRSLAVGAGIDGFTGLDHEACFGAVIRCQEKANGPGKRRHEKRAAHNEQPVTAQAGEQRTDINICVP